MTIDFSVLDASALLAFLKREEGYKMVKTMLSAAYANEVEVLINQINLGEVYCVIARERSLEIAETFIHDYFPMLPITPVSNSMADVIAAAELKIRLDLHYTDTFAANTARSGNAVLLTTDRDFEKAADEIRIRWIR